MQMQVIIDRFLRSEKSIQLKLTCHDRILLTVLASFCGAKKECWPSYDELVLFCGMSKKIVSRALTKLENMNFISIARKYKMNNRYSFVLSSAWELQIDSRVPEKTFSSSRSGVSGVPMGDGNNINNNINNNISVFYENDEQKTKAEEARQEIRRLCHLKSLTQRNV